MSAAQGRLGENWTLCLAGPGRVKFWRMVNTTAAVVRVYAGVQGVDGSVAPAGQAEMAAAVMDAPQGGYWDVLSDGEQLLLLAGEKVVGRCSNADGVSFRVTTDE